MQKEASNILETAVVIAGAAHAGALRKHLSHNSAITVFCESESLEALKLMLAKPPKMLALDSSVVRTARGALLVSELKENSAVEVRVLTEDEESRLLLLVKPDVTLHAASHPLEEGCGTRSARRYPMKNVEVVIDGERSRLVNLSTSGAQVLMNGRVQPRQNLGFTLLDEAEAIETKLRALVAWSAVELGKSAVRYRAGLKFVNPPKDLLETFCTRHAAA